MRIADICEFYSEHGGGVKTYVDQKLEAASRLGHKVSIIAPGPEDRRDPRAGGEIIWIKSPKLAPDPRYHIFWRSSPVHEALREVQPDLIEASSTWRGAWIAAKWPEPTPRVMFAHQDPVAVYPHTIFSPRLPTETVDQLCFWFWFYLRRLTSNFDSTIVGGDWLASRFEKFGVKRPVAAQLGVDKSLFSHELRNRAARMEMLLACGVRDPEAKLFIAVSRHHPEKRIGTMIDGFRAFAKEHPAGLFLIGDGPSRRWVEERAAKIQGVHIAGPIRERKRLAKLLASADFFLHGGAAETFGLVVAEALASGLPLITPDAGGAAELTHPTYAETYRAGDSAALTNAIRRIVLRDRQTLALAARVGAKRVNSPNDHFQALFEYYARLTEEKRIAQVAA
ncbi:MAG: glycosyltransferase [Pseudomonadota bacterium]